MAKKSTLLLLVLFLGFSYCLAAAQKTVDYPEYIIYTPSNLDPTKRHPLVVGLSPGGDAQSVINAWKGTAEEYGWVIFASKIYKNGGDMDAMLSGIANKLNEVFINFPIDKSRVIATGLSGGGMGAHAFSFLYPRLITAVVVNTGIMHEYYIGQKYRYPREKIAVFLASPADFRYGEMKRDRDFLEGLGWQTKWIEFQGGHTMAPDSTYREAAAWLTEQWALQAP